MREIGIGEATGKFLYNGVNYNASAITQNYAASGSKSFVTGVVYADADRNDFYTVGEGVSGLRLAVGSGEATSVAAGGYSVGFAPATAADVTVTQGAATFGVLTVAGGSGNVKLDLVRVDGAWTVEVAATAALKSGFADATLLGIGNFHLTGNALANRLTGNAGDNRLYGGAGNDRLYGDAGADSLDGGAGADTMSGGPGYDRYVVDNPGDVIEGEIGYSQGGGIDTVEAWIDFTMKPNLEILRLQGAADLKGYGTWAPENMVGNTGRNLLDGSNGNDTLNGKAGDDTLIGGMGADLLMGEDGADVFLYRAAAESPAGAAGRDFINGFVHGQDRIDLSAIDANPYAAGDQAFRFIGAAGFSAKGAGAAGELRHYWWGAAGLLVEADINGDGAADMQIYVNLTNYMQAADFIL